MVYGECGRYPLITFCHISSLYYLHRLLTMPGDKIVKSVFHTLDALNGQGFSTWVAKAYDLAQVYDIDVNTYVGLTSIRFKSMCSERMKSVFVENWHSGLRDKPLLRSYKLYKNTFNIEWYLDYVNATKYRISISQISASSHDLEIEHGRYTRRGTDPNQRLYTWCGEIEYENHFIKLMSTNVKMYTRRLVPSTQHFRILITTNNSFFLCLAKAGRY